MKSEIRTSLVSDVSTPAVFVFIKGMRIGRGARIDKEKEAQLPLLFLFPSSPSIHNATGYEADWTLS